MAKKEKNKRGAINFSDQKLKEAIEKHIQETGTKYANPTHFLRAAAWALILVDQIGVGVKKSEAN